MTVGQSLLSVHALQKSFMGLPALRDAYLDVASGEVHALVGQNGAGKSTLIKILTGAYRRDAGDLNFAGRSVDFLSPQAAQRAGIGTVYQEVNLVPLRSVSENIFLGREPKRWGFLDWHTMNRQAQTLLKRFEVDIDVTKPLGAYSVAVQQMVALARAISFRTQLVVMDEPTSSLDDREVEVLFGVIQRLKADGISTLFITHRLDELYAVCDRVTVLRDGATVYQGNMQEIGKLELIAQMLGKRPQEVARTGQTAFEKRDGGNRQELLEANALARRPKVRSVSLSVGRGEIVGLSGLLGAGRTETARLIFGVDTLQGGSVTVSGKPVQFRDPADAIRAGIGFCSEDRKAEGIIPQMSVQENLTLAILPKLSSRGVVDKQQQTDLVASFIDRLGIKTAGPQQPIRELSGGNQQKVLLARWLCMNPALLILDEPTRGIDVGAKSEIQALIDELAASGLGVLMISSELEELAEGCERVVVLHDGASVAELTGEALTLGAIMHTLAVGHVDNSVEGDSYAP